MSLSLRLWSICLIIYTCQSQIVTESATLQVSKTADNSAQVNANNIGHASSQYGWTVNTQNNEGWSWNLNFHNNKWKFQSDRPSTFTLKIYSDSQFLSDDRGMIVLFSQSDTRYLTTLIQLDNDPNKIYPNCGSSFASGNIEQTLNMNTGEDRESKTMNNGNNFNLQPQNNASSCCQNSSPMIMKIVNNPIEGTSEYIYTNSLNSGWSQTCGFTEAWSSSSYLDIYIMGEAIGQDLNILRFELTMEYDATLQPTMVPGKSR